MSDKAKIKATRRSKRKFKKRQQMSNAVVKDTKRRNDPDNKVNTKELEFDIYKRFENVLRNDYGLDLKPDDPQYQGRLDMYMIGVAEVFKYLDHDISRVSNEDASFLYVYLRTSILGYWNERNKATAQEQATITPDEGADSDIVTKSEMDAMAKESSDQSTLSPDEILKEAKALPGQPIAGHDAGGEQVKINALLYPESRGKGMTAAEHQELCDEPVSEDQTKCHKCGIVETEHGHTCGACKRDMGSNCRSHINTLMTDEEDDVNPKA